MPSSLIWIALIAGWILVLFPMVSGSRKPVSRTGVATEETRVLLRGGKSRPVRRGPAAGHLSDPEWQPDPGEEQARRFIPSSNDPKIAPAEVQMDSAATDSEPTEVVEVELATVDAAADEAVTGTPEPETEVVVAEVEEAADDSMAGDVIADAEPAEAEVVVEATVLDAKMIKSAALESPVLPTALPETVAAAVVVEEPVAESADEIVENVAAEVTAGEADEPVYEGAGDGGGRVGGVAAHRTGRGGFDPEADAAARATRGRNRQRTMVWLAGLTAVSLLASFIFTTLFVWGAVTFGLLLVAYLSYLRRQVRMEKQIRDRRMARLQRSRRDAVAVRRAEHTVPGEARRYGAVVLECDDEDPAFDHLPHYESAYSSHETRVAG